MDLHRLARFGWHWQVEVWRFRHARRSAPGVPPNLVSRDGVAGAKGSRNPRAASWCFTWFSPRHAVAVEIESRVIEGDPHSAISLPHLRGINMP